MADEKSRSRALVLEALRRIAAEKHIEADFASEQIPLETPPSAELGDIGMPLFAFARIFRMAPSAIAQQVAGLIGRQDLGEFVAEGPYINVRLNKAASAYGILSAIAAQGARYGSFAEDGAAPLAGRRVMVEFSSPNTNKPLHLGHLRNDALGESVSRILKAAGADVYKVNIINNRGVHICKSMLAYQRFHQANGDTPESLGIKSDRFVGDCYVEFDRWSREDPHANQLAEEMLVKWEAGDAEIRALWERMNAWAISGVRQTYERTGVGFDKLYYESETYLKGRDEIYRGLEKGIFFRAEDGSVRIDVTDVTGRGKDGEPQEKVLLRNDGTSVYITQDIGTAISRHDDWDFNQLVYVVASEQNYHFKVLFYILRKLGYAWADKLFHLSYGLVNLPSGRMKSREGTVVDADDLIDQLRDDALAEIRAKGREPELGNPSEVAEKIAVAALHYYLLQVTPIKDMLFNPQESLSFTGNTGPYLQYMGARISSILRKAEEGGIAPDGSEASAALLTDPAEWDLTKLLGEFPAVVAKAAQSLDPSSVAVYLYEVCKAFSRFYHDCPILSAETDALRSARLFLAQCTLTVLRRAMHLVLVPFVEAM